MDLEESWRVQVVATDDHKVLVSLLEALVLVHISRLHSLE